MLLLANNDICINCAIPSSGGHKGDTILFYYKQYFVEGNDSLGHGELIVCKQEFALYGDVMGACRFAVAAARATEVSFCTGNFGILKHGLFFAALGDKIVVITHDSVHRNTMGALRFALATGMAAVQFSTPHPIGI
jgi:hypothetical protein